MLLERISSVPLTLELRNWTMTDLIRSNTTAPFQGNPNPLSSSPNDFIRLHLTSETRHPSPKQCPRELLLDLIDPQRRV
jgi:hypothetical protein